jgi:putative RecB family exonuclease
MPERLSPSSVSTWLQCPLKFKLRRIDKVPEEQTEAQAVGNMTHEVLEALFLQPAAERTARFAREEMVRIWHDKWQAHAESALGMSAHAQHMMRWNAWQCVENYFGLEDPTTVELAGTEDEVRGHVAGVPVLGFIDRWTVVDGVATISDYKTGKVSKPPYDRDKKLQLMIYADLVEETKEVAVGGCELIYLKGKGTRVVYEPTDELRSETRDTVARVWEELRESCETDDFRTNRTKLCDWCSYKPTCPAWAR